MRTRRPALAGAKGRLWESRRLRPGERIDVAALAYLLDSSATPVRDALHLLVGEGLAETRAGDGFHVPQIDAPTLTDRYQWNAQLLLLALRGAKSQASNSIAPPDASLDGEPAGSVGSLFARIASRTGNAEHMREIEAVNDRLHAARMAESAVVHVASCVERSGERRLL